MYTETVLWRSKCMLNHCLEWWYKWVLTNLDHDRLWLYVYNGCLVWYDVLLNPCTYYSIVEWLIADVTDVSTLHQLSVFHAWMIVRLTLRYTTPDMRCRDRRYECDGGIRAQMFRKTVPWPEQRRRNFDGKFRCCSQHGQISTFRRTETVSAREIRHRCEGGMRIE